jgi:hypothetical protein
MINHTEEFEKQMRDIGTITVDDVSQSEADSFVGKLSQVLTNDVVSKIQSAKNGLRKPVDRKMITVYCKNHGIEPDLKRGDQQAMNFNEPEGAKAHYHLLDKLQEIKVEGRGCFVVNNDIEGKILKVMFDDNSEVREIEY